MTDDEREQREAERRFRERVVDDGVEGMTVDGRPVEPFASWLAKRQPWWRRWAARIVDASRRSR